MRAAIEFGHDIVIISVEPFGHFTGGPTPGHLEIAVKLVFRQCTKPFGNVPQHEAGIQNVVVERKFAHRCPVQLVLPLPVLGA